MRAGGPAVLGIVAFLLAGTAGACDGAREADSCGLYDEHGELRAGASPDLVIGACTAILQSGKESTKGLIAALLNRDSASNDTREYDRAVQDLEEAIKLDPNFAMAYLNRGNAYAGKGDDDRATEDFVRAIKHDPNFDFSP